MAHIADNIKYFKKGGLSFLLLIGYVYLYGQENKYPIVRTPQNIAVNRTLPKGIIAPGSIMKARFSKEPTDDEIFMAHIFEEPLVPVSGEAVLGENAALVYTLAAFSQRSNADDFTAVTNFLSKYPATRWRGALLANLGIVYRRTGYYNQAMDAWEEAWSILKAQTDRKIKILADRVVSELLLINSWIGRQERIEALVDEIDKRVIEGPAVERVSSMKAALWTMKNKPGVSFKCGPYALNKLYTIKDSTKAFNDKLMEAQSTSRGFSLLDLEKMSQDIGLDYQMAFRNVGAEVITNAVVHWKLSHYSALLKYDNGHYKCQDATMGTVYGQEFWLSPAALDSSASGYFLVPKGVLPAGWRLVAASEGAQIFGKGQENPDNGKHVSPDDKQEPDCGGSKPMAQSNVHLLAVSLHIFDRPVYYTPPLGPAMLWNVDYHQRDSYQPANFSYSNLGPKWTFNWLSYVQDNPSNLSANSDVYVMGGGVRTFTSYNATTKSYAAELQTNDVLVRICPDGTCYELRHPDGSKEVYARPDGSAVSGRKVFLTQKVDAAGNIMTLTYDANLRVVALKDAIGQVTTIKYENTDIYKITKVVDPFGRSASFDYDGTGKMNKITDMIGIISSFTYDAGDFITKMTTPYGTTNFTKQELAANIRSLETLYPLGEKERVEYKEFAEGINMSEPVAPSGMNVMNTYLVYRNTFYWDKKAMKEAPGDYTQAKIYHWLHGSGSTNESGIAAPILESIKEPLENRIWYSYQNQSGSISANQGMSSQPSQVGRVLDDGTTQLSQFFYNILGKDTASIDPIGRKFSYKYDPNNNIDLLEVRQTKKGANDLLASFTYNSQHLPLTSKDASGLTTTFGYNTAGQLTSITNPKNETTILYYNSNGYLDSIVGPIKGAKASFAYDGYGRVRTVTDPEGYTITTDYDALNRPTLITYPDGTYQQMVYDRLDPIHTKDRMGRWSHTIYDSLDRPNVVQDALGRITQLIWCSCGSLAEIVDPLKQVTTFIRDIQGRLVAKRYADGKGTVYTYENTTSRLKEVTDAKGQKTQYTYYIDDNLKQRSYTNATIATATVSFTYDSSYNRVKTMTDGTGTTTYSYNPVQSAPGSNMLAAVDGPSTNDVISYTYDSLERVSSRSINGVASSVIYDALGRVTTANNALGSFIYKYINQTSRLSSVNLPNGQTTLFDYFGNAGDQRLKQIWNRASDGSTLSKFNYDFNTEGQITKWTQQAGSNAPTAYDLGYDLADQLTSAIQKNQSTSAIIKRYAYQYDKAGNRTSEQIDNTVTSALYNNLNQLTKQQDSGPMQFKGTLSKFASVVVKNQTTSDSAIAPVDTTNTFEAFVKTVPGNNNITIIATDYSGNNNRSTNTYNINVNAGINNTLAFDNNGNTVSGTAPAVTYGWDAEDRLVKIIQGANVTEFVYDGLSRRIAEKLNGAIIKRWLWDATEVVEERDVSGATVTKRFFADGEQIDNTNYYFTKDHLGSIREMTDVNGVVITTYDYDPYGRRIKKSGGIDADFGFTGYYYHTSSSLYLSLYRAYDIISARWLNRDPIAEGGGANVYLYVKGNPINLIDPLGLIDAPGFGESLIPIWGSGKQAVHDFECGHWGWGLFNTALAISDVFLVKAAGTAASKFALKLAAREGAEVAAKQAGEAAVKEGMNSVYHGVDNDGVVRYVGITERNPTVRFGEHSNSIGTGKEFLNYSVIPGATNLTRTEARVLEQKLINQYGLQKNGGTLLNKINSIAPKNWGLYGIQ